MSRQTTLFGNVLPKQNRIYKNPRTKYEMFVNTWERMKTLHCLLRDT